jgi:hypothetical protein
MTRRSKIWLAADALFILGNIVGGIVAAAQGEVRHASSHLILVAIGVAVAWVIAPKSSPTYVAESSTELSDGLTRLQQSLDAVAVEVERIGEGQRYVTHLFEKADGVRLEAPAPVEADKKQKA